MRNRRRLTPTPEDEAVRSLIEGGGEEEASVTLAEVLADSPIAYWPLQGDTPLNDYSGNGRHLTASSDPVPAQTGANFPTNGLPMRDYHGAQLWDSISAAPFALSDDEAFSIECWALIDVGAGAQDLIHAFADFPTSSGFSLYADPDSVEVVVFIEDGIDAGSYTTHDGAAYAGSLAHFVATWSGATEVLKLYINGAEVGTPDDWGTFGAIAVAETLYLGHVALATVDGASDMAHVAIYSTALSGARVLAHYQEVVP